MAAGVQLVLQFEDNNGNNIVYSFPYAEPGARTKDVVALMDAFIANGDIFTHVPVKKVSAKTVTTSENEYEVS